MPQTIVATEPRPAPLLADLRTATAEAHARLDAGLPLVGPALTREAYGRTLARMAAVHLPLEAAVATVGGWAEVGFDPAAHSRAHLLRRDLQVLDLPIPPSPTLPAIRGMGEAMGVLYVLEGSALGGQVISRHVKRTLGIDPETGGAFFAGHGASTGPMWKAFCAALERFGAAHADGRADAVRAAEETFSLMERWLLPAPPAA